MVQSWPITKVAGISSSQLESPLAKGRLTKVRL